MVADGEKPPLNAVILTHLANTGLANRLVKGGMLLGGALVAADELSAIKADRALGGLGGYGAKVTHRIGVL